MLVQSVHLGDLCLRAEANSGQLRTTRTCEAVVVPVLPLDDLASYHPLGMLSQVPSLASTCHPSVLFFFSP